MLHDIEHNLGQLRTTCFLAHIKLTLRACFYGNFKTEYKKAFENKCFIMSNLIDFSNQEVSDHIKPAIS